MNGLNFITKENILSFIYISVLLAIGRLIPHPPNFTPILAAAIVAPYIMNNRFISLLIPITAMIIADFFIGFYSGIIWVYGSILLCGILSDYSKRFKNYKLQLGAMSLLSSLIFFVITNFSVWFLGDYYPKTYEGLILCYTMAIPFFQNTVISTVVYTGLFVITIEFLKNTTFGLNLRKV
tara:strand:+ start:482 stop:1021 length:540 start_codon:yes stop_codon:yes gene_type:complete